MGPGHNQGEGTELEGRAKPNPAAYLLAQCARLVEACHFWAGQQMQLAHHGLSVLPRF